MLLSSDEVLRFSRQILLTEVGGAGQERLMRAGFVATGDSASLGVSVAYACAGGSPLIGGPMPSEHLRSFGEVREVPKAHEGDLGALSAAGSFAYRSDAVRNVVLGYAGDRAVVIYCGAKGCEECIHRSLRALRPSGGSDDVLLGSLGALIYQHLVWQNLNALGAIAFSVEEGITPWPIDFCPRHGSAT